MKDDEPHDVRQLPVGDGRMADGSGKQLKMAEGCS